jgi:hypothetical protein
LLSSPSGNSNTVAEHIHIPDAEIKMTIKDGSVIVTTDASGINDMNFHLLPSFFESVYREDMIKASIASLIRKIPQIEPRNLLTEQLVDKPKDNFPKMIMWDSSESYKSEGLTSEEIEDLKEELEVDDISIDDDGDDLSEDLEVRIGYANFDIGMYAALIAKCEGVDTFQQMSRYRFCIGIGKHWFNFTDVRKNLTKLLKLSESGV